MFGIAKNGFREKRRYTIVMIVDIIFDIKKISPSPFLSE